MRHEIIECDECGKNIDYPRGVPVAPLSLQVFINGASAVRQPDGSLLLDYCADCASRLTALPKLQALIQKIQEATHGT